MARPKPRSFAADGQDKASSGDKSEGQSASKSSPRSRDSSGMNGGVAKSQSSDVRPGKGKKQSSGASSPIKQARSGNTGFAAAATGSANAPAVSASRAKGQGGNRPGKTAQPKGSQVIPEAVAQRMLRRIAIATGLPSVVGMGVFVGSYFLVSRQIVDIPPVATLLASGGCFVLGLVGLSYGVLSASWEDSPGSLFGTEQLGVNISRVRSSLKAMRQGGSPPPPA